MRRVAISSGHGLYVRGAKGFIDEVDEARRVVDRVAALLRGAGATCHVYHDNSSRSQAANLAAIVAAHNKFARDIDCFLHFNAFQTTTGARGTETLYLTQQKLATDISAALARAGGFINRGAKKRTDLSVLNRSAKPAVLPEICFVDARLDTEAYKQRFEEVCRALAEQLGNVKIAVTPPPPVIPEPPPLVPEPEPQEPPTTDNIVDIELHVKGHATVTVNNDVIGNVANSPNRIALTLEHQGNVIVTINGEDFQIEPGELEPPPPPTGQPRPTIRNGSRGEHVVVLQRALGLSADGIFGNATENAVRAFQRAQGLTADGVVGPRTWAALETVHNIPPFEPAPSILSAAEITRISNLASNSPIRNYNWLNRGRAPIGFIKGMAVSYACAVREFQNRHPAFLDMAKAATGDEDRDALTWMAAQFRAANMSTNAFGLNTLRHVYVLLMGAGMRESTGRYCAGLHQAAGNKTAETAEAGAWQSSWNVRQGAMALITGLFNEYNAGAQGFADVFREGVSCTANDWKSYGSGDGLRFQNLSKEQPRFACEVAGVAARNLRRHYGPINRREAELRPEANEMFLQVERFLEPVIA